ncbi:nuclear transport factor 2 family protein [Roseibacillus persicicus]|uniref:nuclear transport factor 2 family protein n=1 Tax=Roseibacillus persicicus TaxID=454148 RepID=UPI00398B80D5
MHRNAQTLHPVARITYFLANLQPESLEQLGEHYSERVQFDDPINEGHGLDDLRVIFEDLFKQLKNISLDITDSRGDEQAAFLKWVMRYRFRGKARELPGVSYFTFNKEGKVTSQRDYWDAAEGVYSEIPGIGLTLRGIRKMVQVRP